MSDDPTIQAIQERMREVRHELSQDLATSARDITDWRSYVRASPWIAVASAAALGYMLVPKGPPTVRLSGIDLEKLVKQGQTTAVATGQKAKQSLMGSLFSTVAILATKAAVAYFTTQFTNAKARGEEKVLR